MKAELIELIDRVMGVLRINSAWMTWNLFLAFIPLVLSMRLFRKGRDRSWIWGLGFLVVFAFFPINTNYIRSFFVAPLQQNFPLVQLLLVSAMVSVPLSIWLFRTQSGRSVAWWLGFIAFYAFLPNAPYLLTDVIHLIDDIRTIQSVWMITLVLIPLYLVVILGGFETYVISLMNLGSYLQRIGKNKWILPIEMITHALSAVGIYWGRFLRFNSWDFVTQPDAVLTKGVEEILGKQPLAIIVITFVVLVSLYWIMQRVTLGFLRQFEEGIAVGFRRVKN
jgi:uncharacterized membrane protein